jgi:hypothetical protein
MIALVNSEITASETHHSLGGITLTIPLLLPNTQFCHVIFKVAKFVHRRLENRDTTMSEWVILRVEPGRMPSESGEGGEGTSVAP